MVWLVQCPIKINKVVEKAKVVLNEKGDKISPNYKYVIENILKFGLNLKSKELNNYYLVYLNNMLDQALSA